jgi:hypothetical protein
MAPMKVAIWGALERADRPARQRRANDDLDWLAAARREDVRRGRSHSSAQVEQVTGTLARASIHCSHERTVHLALLERYVTREWSGPLQLI